MKTPNFKLWHIPFSEIEDYKGKAIIGKVNVEQYQEIAQEYNVRNIPNLLIFQSGEVQESLVGLAPEHKITEVLNKFI